MLHGRALGGWSDRERARCLAVLPQSSTLSFAFQVEDVVAMGRLPHCSGRQADARIVAAALQAADAQHLAGRSYLRLSGGERQRCIWPECWRSSGRGRGQRAVARRAHLDARPGTSAQHPPGGSAFRRAGGAALVILHDLNLAARYCDRLLLLKNGRAQIAGAPDEVLREAPLQAVFGLDVLVQRHPERGHPWSSPVEEVCGAHHRFSDSGLAERL